MRFLRGNANLMKLIGFIVVTVVTSAFVLLTVDNSVGEATHNYKAVFTDAFGLQSGDDVRIAGVRVGRINSLSANSEGQAVVSFSVEKDVPMRTSDFAELRYRDLLGRRYLNIEDTSRNGTTMAPGSSIPISRTQQAVDLTTLFNGFQPVFNAINPSQINDLAAEIVQAFQGEGGTVNELLASTASLTTTLASHDTAIGQLITNLNSVLSTVSSRDQDLNQLIINLKDLATGLAGNRDIFGDSLSSIDAFVSQASGLLQQTSPAIGSSIKSLNTVVGTVDQNKATLNSALKKLPAALTAAVKALSYGSWLNLYVCDLDLLLPTGQTVSLNLDVENKVSPRCVGE